MKKDGPDGRGACTDLLLRGLEVTSGGMRINRYDELVESAKVFGLEPSGLSEYLSVFRYGCPPLGGFARRA